jgi:sensor histidine kinase YesM
MAGLGKNIIFAKRYRILRHVLFWLVYLVVFTLFTTNETTGFLDGLTTTLLFTPMNMVYVYVLAYWLVPAYLISEKYIRFFCLYCLWVFVGLILNFLFRYYILIPLRTGIPGPPLALNQAYHQVFALGSFVVMNTIAMFGVFIRMFKYWHLELRQKMEIEQQKTVAELELLKAQLHPHFLFNTLNNLYSLVLERSEKAPDMLMRLSALLNYVLYECKSPEVSLGKEILIMKDYIALEQERYGQRLDVSLNFSGDIGDKTIAPMLFQPFVENAFKHGTAEQLGRVWLSIELSVRQDQLFFRVINSVDGREGIRGNGGIGINNVRRRLELLYTGKFSLQQDAGKEVHIITLTIDLDVTGSPRRLSATMADQSAAV